MEEKAFRLRSDVEAEEVEREIDAVWTALQSDPTLRERAASAGVDLAKISGVKRSDAITVRREGSGFSGVEILIGLGIAIAKDVWAQIILPRLKQKFGSDAIAEK